MGLTQLAIGIALRRPGTAGKLSCQRLSRRGSPQQNLQAKLLSGSCDARLPEAVVINLKTAKAPGLDVPLQLQQRADEIIE